MSKNLLPGDGPNSGKSQFLVYEAEGGRVKIDVRLEDETVWLTQQLMADLFQTSQQNISLHIQNVYEEGELAPEGTHKESLSVRHEGSREVRRLLDYYNLDMIISVGYRVKSHVATRVRRYHRRGGSQVPGQRAGSRKPTTPPPGRPLIKEGSIGGDGIFNWYC